MTAEAVGNDGQTVLGTTEMIDDTPSTMLGWADHVSLGHSECRDIILETFLLFHGEQMGQVTMLHVVEQGYRRAVGPCKGGGSEGAEEEAEIHVLVTRAGLSALSEFPVNTAGYAAQQFSSSRNGGASALEDELATEFGLFELCQAVVVPTSGEQNVLVLTRLR
jgi:hypothetical protein